MKPYAELGRRQRIVRGIIAAPFIPLAWMFAAIAAVLVVYATGALLYSTGLAAWSLLRMIV